MKLAILSRNAKLYSTQRLIQAARERGHTVRVLDPLRCYMLIAPGQFQIKYKGKVLKGIDAVIPVSAYIPGCPVKPESIIDGVAKLLNQLEKSSA